MARHSLGKLVVFVASAFVFFASSPAAQVPAPQRLQVQIVNVRPETLNDWLALQEKETVPALKKIGVASREAWTTSVFGEGYQFIFTQPIGKFADYDNPQGPMIRALGQEAARVYNDKLRRMILSSRTLAITILPESIATPASYVPKFMVLNFNYVIPGHTDAYEAYLKNDFMPAIKNVKMSGYGVSRTLHGGDGNEYVTARYLEKMADLDGPNLLTQAIGADAAAKMSAKTSGMFERQERSIYRFVPALSIKAGSSTSSQR